MTPIKPTEAWVDDVVDILGDILTLNHHTAANALSNELGLKRRAKAALMALGLTPDVQATLREAAQMRIHAEHLRSEAARLDAGADEFLVFKAKQRAAACGEAASTVNTLDLAK